MFLPSWPDCQTKLFLLIMGQFHCVEIQLFGLFRTISLCTFKTPERPGNLFQTDSLSTSELFDCDRNHVVIDVCTS